MRGEAQPVGPRETLFVAALRAGDRPDPEEYILSATLLMAEALALQQRTRSRLEQEQTQLEREIARIESRRDTLQESRGTGALRLLLESGLGGLHGPVAQLAEVEERFRVALEVAADGPALLTPRLVPEDMRELLDALREDAAHAAKVGQRG